MVDTVRYGRRSGSKNGAHSTILWGGDAVQIEGRVDAVCSSTRLLCAIYEHTSSVLAPATRDYEVVHLRQSLHTCSSPRLK
jgi:hypothetical protein